MRLDMVHNFFQFIDFLHLNIDNFNQNSNIYIGMGNCKGKKKLYQENTSRKKNKINSKNTKHNVGYDKW